MPPLRTEGSCNPISSQPYYNIPMDDEQKREEYLSAKQILSNNQYDTKLLDNTLDKITKTAKKKRESADQAQEDNNTTTKWAKFTYVGMQTKFNTKLVRKTNIKIAFTTENTIAKFLTRKNHDDSNKYKRSGVYQLSCQNCNKKYIGQTGRAFQKPFQVHLNDFKNKYGRSKFAQHLINNTHAMGPLEDVMKVLRTVNKGGMMKTLENFQIYKEIKVDNQINDRGITKQNISYDAILQGHPARGHPA